MTVIARTERDVFDELEALRRSLGTIAAGRAALRGAAAGALGGTLALVFLHGQPVALPAAVCLIVLGSVAGVVLSVRSWPSLLQAARTADRHLDLANRAATAVELRGSGSPFAVLQRRDLVERLGDVRLTESAGRRLQWRELAAPLLATAVLIAALVVGLPSSHGARAAQGGDAGRIHRVASTRLPHIVSGLNRGLTSEARQSAALRKLNLALARLQRRLVTASTRAAALRSISATQAQLRHIASSLHPVNQRAIAQLNASLAAQAGERASAKAAGRAQIAQATRVLKRLAASLKHATPAQRTALAQALARAAGNSPDAAVRSSLQRAASSLAYGDPQSASEALREASQAIAGTPSARQAQARLSAAGDQLDGLKSRLVPDSGATGASGLGLGSKSANGEGSGQGGGKGATSGKGSGQGQGSGQGSGSGTGQGKGTGSGQGSGQSSGSGQGKGGTGGHGLGGGQGGPGGHARGRYATVYVPVKQGKGSHTIQTGPTGRPVQVPLVPYQQVLARYLRSAHSSLDSRAIPPSRQRYVRQYFSALSH